MHIYQHTYAYFRRLTRFFCDRTKMNCGYLMSWKHWIRCVIVIWTGMFHVCMYAHATRKCDYDFNLRSL